MIAEHAGILAKAKSKWNEFKTNNVAIDYINMEAVFVAGILTGDDSDWQFAWRKYSALRRGQGWERWALLSALGATKNKADQQK